MSCRERRGLLVRRDDDRESKRSHRSGASHWAATRSRESSREPGDGLLALACQRLTEKTIVGTRSIVARFVPQMDEGRARTSPSAPEPCVSKTSGDVLVLLTPPDETHVEAVDVLEVTAVDGEEKSVAVVRRDELRLTRPPRSAAVAQREEHARPADLAWCANHPLPRRPTPDRESVVEHTPSQPRSEPETLPGKEPPGEQCTAYWTGRSRGVEGCRRRGRRGVPRSPRSRRRSAHVIVETPRPAATHGVDGRRSAHATSRRLPLFVGQIRRPRPRPRTRDRSVRRARAARGRAPPATRRSRRRDSARFVPVRARQEG